MEVNKDGFVCCPLCGRKTKTKVNRNTKLFRFPLYCTWCKKEVTIDYGFSQSQAPELSPNKR